MKNIVLIGFMGTGKTAVGKRLARRLNLELIDTDVKIEEITGKTVAQIFSRDGVVRFRSEEALLIKKLAARKSIIIATGGGVVLNPENIRLLRENGIIILLTASQDIICERLKNKKNRPLLLKGDLLLNVSSLLKERKGLYDVADFSVDTGSCNIDEAVEKIICYLNERNYFNDSSPG